MVDFILASQEPILEVIPAIKERYNFLFFKSHSPGSTNVEATVSNQNDH